jgi:hypothetical protein
MRSHLHVLAAMLGLAAVVQAQTWYIPDNAAAAGGCNVIPFGNVTPSTSWSNQKYQAMVTASDLGSLPGLITGIAFAPCGTGDRDADSLQIVLDHIPASTTTLSTTFAANLTASAVTVLNATNFTWRQTANTWTNVGLQNYFVYNGIDNVVIEITSINGRGNVSTPVISSAGMRTGSRQRVYATSWTGTPPATGSTDSAAVKLEFSMLMARTSLHGRGCPQSNGVRPNHVYTGTPQVGQGMSFDLQAALPNSVVLLATGGFTGFPFPIDLTTYGFPGCFAYHAITSTLVLLASASGTATLPVTVPNSPSLAGGQMNSQYFCLDPVTGRLTSSNYGAILIGN